jgi:hypothetical protein
MQRLAHIEVFMDLSLFSHKIPILALKFLLCTLKFLILALNFWNITEKFPLILCRKVLDSLLMVSFTYTVDIFFVVKVRIIYIYISIGKLNNLSWKLLFFASKWFKNSYISC